MIIAAYFAAIYFGIIPKYEQICESDKQTAHKDCATYNTASFVLIKIFKFLNDYAPAIGGLATVFIAGFTFTLWRATDKLWNSAESQGRGLERSIAEAAKAAEAMEDVAEAMSINGEFTKLFADRQLEFSQIQMRAYLSVLIGGGAFQDRKKNWKFEATPTLQNTGMTPAKRVKWRARAAILPNPFPPDFKFTLPKEGKGANLLTPHQSTRMLAVVDEFVPDEEVVPIKQGHPKALYVWGVVSYVDIFGRRRRTTFAHQMFWAPTKPHETPNGWYLSKHNTAN